MLNIKVTKELPFRYSYYNDKQQKLLEH